MPAGPGHVKLPPTSVQINRPLCIKPWSIETALLNPALPPGFMGLGLSPRPVLVRLRKQSSGYDSSISTVVLASLVPCW